ncbi:ArnT family glycosyltransferase [Terrihabitans sp. B22-R8]|uniref:ArnT family glycosyltransferase n=1 Tax=Terrihabitans sp. B22-R8 TaxID=3425128 RepID=UPI00403D1B00
MSGQGRRAGLLRTPGALFLVLLAGYFAVQILLRVLTAHSLGLDEAEILVTTQSAAWGHGTQPPLYNFLQIAAFELFGVNIFALALVKNLLLFAIFAFVFLAARMVLGHDLPARMAAGAMFTIPQLAWESQRALTHTIIVLAMAAITLFVLVRVLRDGRVADYALLGLCIGLGALSKYNFGLGALAMIAAAASVRELRPRILSPMMLLTLGIAALVVLPHALWVSDNLGAALARTHKFEAKAEAAYTFAPILAVLAGALQYAAVPLGIFALCLGIERVWPSGSGEMVVRHDPLRRFALRIIPIGLLMLLIGAVPTGTTEFKDRWMSPLLFLLPLVLVVWAGHRLGRNGGLALQVASAVLAVVAMVMLSALHVWPRANREPPDANTPMPALAMAIRAQGFATGTILASHTTIAGQLKLEFPGSLAVDEQYGPLRPFNRDGDILLAWRRQDAPPSHLGTLYAEICGRPIPAIRPAHLTAPYQHSAQTYSLNVAVLRGCEDDGVQG